MFVRGDGKMGLFEYIDIMNQPYDIFYTDNVHSSLHWHYYSEILYVISGSIRIVCNNKELVLHMGDICYFYPLQLHGVEPDTECTDNVRYAVIKFNIQTIHIPKAYLQNMYDCFVHRTTEEDFCLILHHDEKIPAIIENIVEEYENKEIMHMLAVQSGIFTLLIAMARKIDKKKPQCNKQPAQNLSFYHILEYIDTHSSEQLEVQKLAEMCHMSYSNFARIFRENYGRSCKEYIQYIRMNKAQDLLLNSDFDLDYISQETGFYDCSHFIKQYKKWRGITPKQERIQNKTVLSKSASFS